MLKDYKTFMRLTDDLRVCMWNDETRTVCSEKPKEFRQYIIDLPGTIVRKVPKNKPLDEILLGPTVVYDVSAGTFSSYHMTITDITTVLNLFNNYHQPRILLWPWLAPLKCWSWLLQNVRRGGS